MTTKPPRIGFVLTGTYHGADVIGRLTESWRGVNGGMFYAVELDGKVRAGAGVEVSECLLSRDEINAWTVVDAVAAPTRATANGRVLCG